MFYGPSIIAVGISGLLLLIIQVKRYFFSAAAPTFQENKVPARIWLVLAVIYVLLAAGGLVLVDLDARALRLASAVAAFLLAGILAKWVWDASLKSFQFESADLVKALAVAPLVMLAGKNVLDTGLTLNTVLLCFSNGFFWQTIFSDLQRRKRKTGQHPHQEEDEASTPTPD